MPELVDSSGRPIRRQTLTEPQTAQVGWLHQTFAGHPSRGLTPAKLARILEDAERGDLIAQFDLFDDMEEKDGHIFAEMAKRKRALLGLAWDIEPPRGASGAEKRQAEAARELLLDVPQFEDVLLDMADAIGKGFAALEIEWMRQGTSWTPRAITHRPQQWFQVDPDTRTEIRLRNNSAEGAPLEPFGWILHAHRARSGYIARSGLHRVLVWPYLFKNYAVRDLAEFCEIYGLPVRLGRYPSGATQKERATLLAAVMGIGHSAAGIIPENMNLEFLEAADGTHQPFAYIIDWAERTESKAIVGQTLSAESKATGLGSGVADLHGEVRRDILESDAMQLAGTITRDLLYPLVALNLGITDPRRAPRFAFDCQEPEDLKLLADALPKLVGIGVRIPATWVNERAKLPVPAEGEEVLAAPAAPAAADPADPEDPDEKKAPPPAPPPGTAAAADQRLARPAGATFFDQVVLDAGADALAPEVLQRELEQTLRPVLDLIEQGADFEAIGDRLAEAYPQMSTGQLEELLARAIFVSDTWGRLATQRETPTDG